MSALDPNLSPLGPRNARHLLRRACFRYTKSQIDQLAGLTGPQALDLLCQIQAPILALPYDPQPTAGPDGFWTESASSATSFTGQGRKANIVAGWWWYNALNDNTLRYKLSYFLSTRFTVEKQNGAGSATEFYDHLRLCMFYAYGSYKTFARKMTLDNSMLNYLNNTTNNKNSPNENYAREFFELFTIGKGPQIGPGNYTHYTEQDIVQAARVLTGFKRNSARTTIDPDTNLPRGSNNFSQHHTGTKVFSQAFNQTSISPAANAEGMDLELAQFVDMVFGKIETARHLSRKLYLFFVRGKITPEIEQQVIFPLADELFSNDYNLLPVVRRLLASKHFYDLDDADANDEIIGGMVKSPLQLLSETCSYLQATLPNPTTQANDFYITFWQNFAHNTFLSNANMVLFDPDNVAGHPAYHQSPEYDRAWISSSTLIARYRMGESMLDGRNRIGNNGNIVALIKIVEVIRDGGLVSNADDPQVLCQDLCDALFGQSPDADRVAYFKTSFLLQGMEDSYWTNAWTDYLNNNNASVVEPRLKLLLRKILSAPEFQLC